MKTISKVIGYIFICSALFSCSTTSYTPNNADDLILINSAFERGNIKFLIDALDKYPLYREYTKSCLYDFDYSNESYTNIKKYVDFAQNNVYATIFFDSLLLNKQISTIDSLSKLSTAEVGEFYRVNGHEHDYLKDILREAYFEDVLSLDYRNRKTLYLAFKDTDLSTEIEQPYHELRDSLLYEIKSVLNPYFDSEREILTQIEEVVRYESQKYIELGVENIITAANEKNDRGLFKKIFKRENIDNYSFKEYLNKIINETYDQSYIDKLIKDRLSEYITSSNQLRSMLFNQYFSDDKYKNIYLSDSLLKSELVWVIGRGDISEIQSIKNTGTALTIGSMALGFVPGIGAIAIAADVADLAYGLSQDGQINKAIEQMANTIYNDSSRCIDNYVTDIFKGLVESQKETEKNIIKIFNDEF